MRTPWKACAATTISSATKWPKQFPASNASIAAFVINSASDSSNPHANSSALSALRLKGLQSAMRNGLWTSSPIAWKEDADFGC